MRTGSLHLVKDGELEIVKYVNAHKVLIRFTATGYERYARAGDIRNKKVKDRLLPSVCGVGFLGNTKMGDNLKAYHTWHNMLMRCYCETYQKTYPYWKDCTVCEDWHNFENFKNWYEANYIEGHDSDKDKQVEGNRVYSPACCEFLPKSVNRLTMGRATGQYAKYRKLAKS